MTRYIYNCECGDYVDLSDIGEELKCRRCIFFLSQEERIMIGDYIGLMFKISRHDREQFANKFREIYFNLRQFIHKYGCANKPSSLSTIEYWMSHDSFINSISSPIPLWGGTTPLARFPPRGKEKKK